MVERTRFVYPIPQDVEAIDVGDDAIYSKDCFFVPKRFQPYIESILLPDGIIQSRWERLAQRIIEDYKDEDNLTVVVLMNGGYRFFEDLKIKLNNIARYQDSDKVTQITPLFVKLSSYKNT